ncbi:MAG TPA: hypothetical protein VFZ65_12700 [Planctomycetota bacterium]|nr:hypothetical protein [Planctomycetota bacterium]
MHAPLMTRLAMLTMLLLGVEPGLAQEVPEKPAPEKPAPEPPAPEQPAPAKVELAIIVNAKNPTKDLSSVHLRLVCKLETQFWSNNERVQLGLRPGDTPEMKILCEHVYGMTQDELSKYWTGRLFRGQIPAEPAILRSSDAAIRFVKRSAGALSVIPATEIAKVPKEVRVLTIDGKLPGQPGYALEGVVQPPPEPRNAMPVPDGS